VNEADFIDLVEQAISGEISQTDRRRLEDYMRENPEARRVYEETLETCKVLDGVRDIEPPAGMARQIMYSIDRGRYGRTPWYRALFGRKLSYAYVFILGALVGIIVLSAIPGLRYGGPDIYRKHLYGTIADPETGPLPLLERVKVETEGVSGHLSLSGEGGLVLLEAGLSPVIDSYLILRYDPERISLEALVPGDDKPVGIESDYGVITVNGTSTERYVLSILEPGGGDVLRVELHSPGCEPFHHEFRLGNED
jgi:hypothetical protein